MAELHTRGVRIFRNRLSQPQSLTTRALPSNTNKPPAKDYDYDRVKKSGLRDGLWEGRPAFLVGGGPSLKGFDFKRLEGFPTIGINKAFQWFDPTIIHSMDTRIMHWIDAATLEPGNTAESERLRDKFYSFKGLKVWTQTVDKSLYPPDIIPIKVYRSGPLSFGLQEGLAHGGNSGYSALNLAFILKANPIYLLGYDMGWNPNAEFSNAALQGWFHTGYPVRPQKAGVYNRFIAEFNKMAAHLGLRNVKIVNLSPNSRLECFPKDTLDSIPQNTSPTFISYYTDTEPYRTVVKNLERSLILHGCKYQIEKVPDTGTWLGNTSFKAEFILQKMYQIDGPVVWIDADAIMNRYPVEFDTMKTHIGYHKRQNKELLSGTLFFSNSPDSKMLVQLWAKKCMENQSMWDQRCLQRIMEDYSTFSETRLPASYCCIFDSMPEGGDFPHIEHFQASRQVPK